MNAPAKKPDHSAFALQLLQAAERVQRGTATDQDAALMRRAADMLAVAVDLPVDSLRHGIQRIAAERVRHYVKEGHTLIGDFGRSEELAAAASCYALALIDPRRVASSSAVPPVGWPWAAYCWKPLHPGVDGTGRVIFGPSARIRELEKAGALIAAAIDALVAESGAGEGGAA